MTQTKKGGRTGLNPGRRGETDHRLVSCVLGRLVPDLDPRPRITRCHLSHLLYVSLVLRVDSERTFCNKAVSSGPLGYGTEAILRRRRDMAVGVWVEWEVTWKEVVLGLFLLGPATSPGPTLPSTCIHTKGIVLDGL